MHEEPHTYLRSTGSSEAMQLLCIAALLLSAVAAQLDADSKRGDGEQPVTKAPEDGDEGSQWDSGHPWVPDFMPDKPGVPLRGHGRRFGRPRGPPRGKRPNSRNPGAMEFSPVFEVDSVTFQNATAGPLKEGESIFLMPKHGGRGHHHHHQKGGRHGPPKNGQYVKLTYKATEPNKVSIEFGLLKPINLGEFVGEEDNPEEYY